MPTTERTAAPVLVCGWHRELVDALQQRTSRVHLVLDPHDAARFRHPSSGAHRSRPLDHVHLVDDYAAGLSSVVPAEGTRPAIIAGTERAADALATRPAPSDDRTDLIVDAVWAQHRPRVFVAHSPDADGSRVLPASAHPELYRALHHLHADAGLTAIDGPTHARLSARPDGTYVITAARAGLGGGSALLVSAYLRTDVWETIAAVATGQGYHAPRPLSGVVGAVSIETAYAPDVWELAAYPGVIAWHVGRVLTVAVRATDEVAYARLRREVITRFSGADAVQVAA